MTGNASGARARSERERGLISDMCLEDLKSGRGR